MPARRCSPTIEAYVDYVAARAEEGFKAVKFHCWCLPERDLPMCEAVNRQFAGRGMALMLDAEQRYDLHGAIMAARRLGELGLRWFEAPLPDTDIEGYRTIRRASTVPIIAAGNTWLDLSDAAAGAPARRLERAAGRCDHLRRHHADPQDHGAGRSLGTTVEIQCWGYTLTQAANLHLMLAYAIAPISSSRSLPRLRVSARNAIRTDREGYVHAPGGPGSASISTGRQSKVRPS